MPHPIAFSCPLPPDDLRFVSMAASEGLSALGEMQLSLVSAKADIKPEDLLGQPVALSLEFHEVAKRYLHGYVTRFGLGQRLGSYYGYRATVRPWLWFLTRTTDCRIFQNKTVPEIVKSVFEDHSVANFQFNLFRSYSAWNYCVQYRESDFNFVARLLEHEGIYWYFEHTDSGHKLVLVDSHSAHDSAAQCECLPFIETTDGPAPHQDLVSAWSFEREVRTGKVATTSYDFERPSADLAAQLSTSRAYELGDYELFDFQGDYTQAAQGQHWAENRLDEHQHRHELLRGTSNAQGLSCGYVLELRGHPRADQNSKYLITSTQLSAHQPTAEADSGDHHFSCDFRAIPQAQQYRPPRRTPKPFVQGPQTAVVVGPSGQEIHTDSYGRVKLQFHWDRRGNRNERSSCWVRVSQPWAGQNFGGMHIPRMGQEVVVSFLEGDPDQPLITGRVYNADQMPPWDLPANATQSGFLTRSTQGGNYGTANAIRFEDKKGSEELWIHAERNQRIEVEADESHSVGHDRSKTIGHDETTEVGHDRAETVGNNESISIGVDRTETVGSNETITIGANRSINVGGSETAAVALQRTHVVGVNESIAIGAAQEIVIGAAQMLAVGASQTVSVGVSQTIDVGGMQTTTVGANQSTTVGSNQSNTIGADQSNTIGKSRSTQVASDDALTVGKNLVIDAGESVVLKTGSASILMKKDGTIVIKGKDITLKGSGKISVKADGDVVVKGAKIGMN